MGEWRTWITKAAPSQSWRTFKGLKKRNGNTGKTRKGLRGIGVRVSEKGKNAQINKLKKGKELKDTN